MARRIHWMVQADLRALPPVGLDGTAPLTLSERICRDVLDLVRGVDALVLDLADGGAS